ncbi:tRNA pseudouridine(55) synthase TruB [Porticoccaceae bacterium LTM1]|nr:tRNA pseudouridine(55) synthase TruB [Porticoccaceae bacterium LTM1]
MGRRRRQRGRPVSGVFVLNKPTGMSSNDALQRVKYLMFADKAGHTGSLDPLATGVLPICLGEATKFSHFLLDSDKGYRSTFRFGLRTETGDSDGEVIEQKSASHLTREVVEKAIEPFRGDIEQVPSMYSALKHNGEPLYKLARQGITVEREARPCTIFEYDLLDFRPGEVAEADVFVHCTKGTYIRSLAEDLGEALGVGAHVSMLHRTQAGPFFEEDATSLEELERLREGKRGEDMDYLLKPTEAAVDDLPGFDVPEESVFYFKQGQPVMCPEAYREAEEGDIVRVFMENGPFLGVAEVLEDGRVAPRRLVVDA